MDSEADLVVAVGGDGTVRGCAEGVASTGVPLGIVPHGTANLLARTLGIPGHPRAALDVALDQRRPTDDRLIDLAIADREPFTAMAGMGLDAAVVAGTKLKHQFGWFAYAMSGAMPQRAPGTSPDFPILGTHVNGHPLVYLDSAASSQRPMAVLRAVEHYETRLHANVHRGVHSLSQWATAAYEGSREAVARFINAPGGAGEEQIGGVAAGD